MNDDLDLPAQELIKLLEDNIRSLAKIHNIKLYELAVMVDMTVAGFYKMLNLGSIKLKTLFKIANRLNLPITSFFQISETHRIKAYRKIKLNISDNELMELRDRVKLLETFIANQQAVIDLIEKGK